MEIYFSGEIYRNITPTGEDESFKASSESQLRENMGKRLKELGYPLKESDGVQIIRNDKVIAWIGFQQHIKFDDYEITICGGDTISVKNSNVFMHITGEGDLSISEANRINVATKLLDKLEQ